MPSYAITLIMFPKHHPALAYAVVQSFGVLLCFSF